MTFIISGTGSRSLQTASIEEKKRVARWVATNPLVGLRALKTSHGDELVGMTGLAEGFDALLARLFIDEEIPYIAAIPSPTYGEYYWKYHSVTGYNRIEKFEEYLDHAEEVVYVCDHHNYGKANFERNHYMVDRADALYVYRPQSPGTRHALKAIQAADKAHHIIPDRKAN